MRNQYKNSNYNSKLQNNLIYLKNLQIRIRIQLELKLQFINAFVCYNCNLKFVIQITNTIRICNVQFHFQVT